MKPMTRRKWIETLGAAGIALGTGSTVLAAPGIIRKPIPSSGEEIPTIGIGSWQSFDVPASDVAGRNNCTDVLRKFFELGGGMVDSSPMYGNAQAAIGQALAAIGDAPGLFSATKVWTSGREAGIQQMQEAERLWGVQAFDLLQVHNLMDWSTHLQWLTRWKQEGRVRYTGITTSHGSRHEQVGELMKHEPFDFVQFTYSLGNRAAEQSLLPLAQEHGKAVIINRAFQGGQLFSRVRGKALPGFAADFGCESWAQYFLKWVTSHPAVTCVIPATSKLHHLEDNMGAMHGRLPNADERREMERYFDSLG